MENRVQLKTVKWIAVLGSIIGLALLWYGVRAREIPTVQIGAIDLQYNMALARVQGTVLDSSIDEIKDSFRLTVDDGTGRITLNGFSKYSRFKDAMGDSFPRIGDSIAAIGNLSVSESWGISMFLASPRRLELLQRKKLESLSPGTLTRKDIGRTGAFNVEITDVRTFKSGISLTVKDSSGSTELTVFNSELELLPQNEGQALQTTGTKIRFMGRVDAYRNKLQLRLLQPDIPENLEIITATTTENASNTNANPDNDSTSPTTSEGGQ